MRTLQFFAFAVALCCGVAAHAQGGNTGTGSGEGDGVSLSERLLKLEKKTEAFNFYLNFAGSFQEHLAGKETWGAFRAKQLRLEIRGQFGKHLTYRIRHRLNKANGAMGEDNFAKATDIMMAGWKFNDALAVQAGKMCQYWGGFEFDENPMCIYEYSDMVENMDNFLAGVALVVTPIKNQEFVLNVTNSYNGKFSDFYSGQPVTYDGLSLEPVRHPLACILNWNGRFLGGRLNTRWAVGYYAQGKGEGRGQYGDLMVFLGQQLNLERLQWYVDYMRSDEGMDRLGIVTSEWGRSGQESGERKCYATDVCYQSVVTKLNWQFARKFNLMGKFMYETASCKALRERGSCRTALGWVASLEHYPLQGQDLRFFLAYVGRNYIYAPVSEASFPEFSGMGQGTHRIELGLMYRIKCY